MGIMPKRADSHIRVLGSVIPTGTARVVLEVPSGIGPVPLERTSLFVPMENIDVPFLILGRIPLFEHFEVRVQEWRQRFGLMHRGHPLARQADSAGVRGLASMGPRRQRHRAKGRRKSRPSTEREQFSALQKKAGARPLSDRQIAAGIKQAKRAGAPIDLSGPATKARPLIGARLHGPLAPFDFH